MFKRFKDAIKEKYVRAEVEGTLPQNIDYIIWVGILLALYGLARVMILYSTGH